ncbi:MAG TPA: hypothetical protein VHO24_01035 [Opitutaceae bacterium]|nr:hypothetical protein [Opitutaceae bacterium]
MLTVATSRAGDPNVIITATASPDYTHRKFNGSAMLPESYVVMQGKYFEGTTIDKSIDRMPFKRVVDYFVPELARREYWPAKTAQNADLVIVVHWGTTVPRVASREMMARTSPTSDTAGADVTKQVNLDAAMNPTSGGPPEDVVGGLLAEQLNEGDRLRSMDVQEALSEQFSQETTNANLAQILGYSRTLHKFTGGMSTTEEEKTLRFDLTQERYFIILKAYDLKKLTKRGFATTREPEWVMHINVQSPGTNFRLALDRMSAAAVNFFGRTTDAVETVRPGERQGKVIVGEPIIVREK